MAMAPLTTTRTRFELRVGPTHTIEVILLIRLSDIAWWNSNLHHHERQLYKLIGRRVMPVECREEIEADRANAKIRDAHANNEAKRKKGEVVIGEANLKKKKAENEKSSGNGNGKKRGAGRKTKKETKSSKKQKMSEKNNAKDPNEKSNTMSESKEKKTKLLREPGKWIMGKSIQICYMMEDIINSTAATLIFRTTENTSDNTTTSQSATTDNKQSQSSDTVVENEEKLVPLATFRSWKKLPKRLSIWVFKFDPDDPSDLSVSKGGGFPRPELLPMSDIFRSAGGESD